MPRLAPVLAALALLAAGSAFTADAVKRGLAPAVEPAAKGERCVEDTATMRRNHMRFLEHQRDDTVHGGIRGAKHSLKGCVDCHASRTTGSVAAAKTDFCVACHSYAAVKIDCFGCHATKPASAVAAAGAKP
jgi:[DsrC]-trisulfide reductase subunit J